MPDKVKIQLITWSNDLLPFPKFKLKVFLSLTKFTFANLDS